MDPPGPLARAVPLAPENAPGPTQVDGRDTSGGAVFRDGVRHRRQAMTQPQAAIAVEVADARVGWRALPFLPHSAPPRRKGLASRGGR